MSADALVEALSCTIETRDDGAVIYRNAEGQLHRTHGPAIIYPSGVKGWYQNGLLHRTDGPAVVFPTGEQHWYQNGVLHREDGPAITYPGGNKCWYRNGKLHRTDGPANIFNGISHWFLNDMRLSEEEFNRRVASGEYLEP